MKIKETEAAIEAILFAMGGSVELSQIAKAIRVDEKTTGKIIRNMMDRYQEEDRGIQIIELENSFQMCTKKEYYEYLINIALHPQKPVLTDVMLETLSIIAYKQPVTKAEIEKIRGVKCDHAINKLVEYNLVCELGHIFICQSVILLNHCHQALSCSHKSGKYTVGNLRFLLHRYRLCFVFKFIADEIKHRTTVRSICSLTIFNL